MNKFYTSKNNISILLNSLINYFSAKTLENNTIVEIGKYSTAKAFEPRNHFLSSKNLKFSFSFLLLISIVFAGQSWGQSIFTNPITGTNPNSSNPYIVGQTVNGNITASGIERGTGVTSQNATNTFSASGWNSSSLNVNDFYQFTITPNSCFRVSMASFVFNSTISSGSINLALKSSADNYGSNIANTSLSGTSSNTFSLSGASFQNLTAAVTYRLYGWNASSSGRTFSVNDFTFNGTVASSSPVFSTQPTASATYCQNTSPVALTIAATAGSGTISSYQWFSNTTASNSGGTSISGANWLSYNPSGSVAGTYYYYCVVTNSLDCSTPSNVSTMVITAQPSGNFSYAAAGYCNSSGIQTINASNFIGATGTFSSSAGLSVNSSNGSVTPSSSTASSSPYTVTYNVPSFGGCNAYSTTTTVRVDQAGTGTISYTPTDLCRSSSTPVSPIITGAGGTGNSTWVTGAPSGLAITGSGVITPSSSTAGTYTITYFRSASGYCPQYSSTTSISINSIPTTVSTIPSSNCGTGNVNLGASPSAGTINWFSASSGGTLLGTGSSFTTPSISSTTTYFAEAINSGCLGASRTAVIATINTIPSVTSSTPASRCDVGTLVLSAIASAGNINWFSAATGGTSLFTGNNFTTPILSASTTYFAEAVSNGCSSASRTAVVATVNNGPAITSVTSTSRCSTGAVTLNASSSAGTINWYAAATGGSSIGTGTSFTTASLASNATYFVDATANGCTTPTRSAVTATITTIPAITATTLGSNCGTGAVTLGATASVGTISWFTTSTGGSSVGSGVSFTTPSISTSTSYFADATNSGCTTSSRTSVLATINPQPTISGSTAGSRCGAGTVILSATSAATINWFSTSSGGTSIGTGTSFTTPSISVTTTYFAEAFNGTCSSAARTAVVATVNPIPTITASSGASRCSTGTVTLTATASAGSINWYAAATSGASLATGTSFATPSLTTTTTYFVDATNLGCTSTSRTAIVAIINAIPTITATTPGSNCGTGTVSLGATSSAGTINWYSASSGGISIGTGATFVTPSISTTTTYFTDATNNGCTTTSRTPVIATINPIPTITSSVGANRCGTGTITLTAASATGTLSWFTALTGGISLGAGTSFTTPSISSTTTYFVQTTSAAGCVSSRTSVVAAVNPIPTLTISPNYCSDAGLVVLTATPGLTSYLWNNQAITQILNVDIAGEYSVTATNTFGCSAFTSIFVAEEKVLNGDFTDGNVNFITNYTYKPDIAGQIELWPEGTYAIVNNANNVHSHFNGKDRFFGTGNIMVINGSPSLGATVWSQNNISVLPNTTYYFSAWAMSVVNGNNATLQFSINGGQIGTIAFLPNGYSNNNGPYNWIRFYGQWNSGPSTSANLSVVNLNTVLGGNDFAMDDISFGTLSPIELDINPIANSSNGVCVNSELYLTSNAVGGASPFTYSWSGPNSFTSTAANPIVTNNTTTLNNGIYSLTVTDGFGCSKTKTVTVSANPLPNNQTATAISPSICAGQSTSIQIASSEVGISYQLRNNANDQFIGDELQGTGSALQFPTGILTNNTSFNVFAIRYTTSCGRELSNVVSVTVAITPVLIITNQAVCSGTVNLTAPAVTLGSIGGGTLSYWTNITATTSLTNPSAVASNGTYFIRSMNGSCSDIKPVVVSITPNPVATFSYAGSPFCESGINPSPIFSGSAIAGTFTSTAGLVFISASTGQINLASTTPGTYTITNRIAPSGSCAAVTATTTITITAAPNPNFSYSSNDLCQSLNVANASPIFDIGANAGTFSSSAGLNLVSTSTGVINISASTPGNYAVVNALPANAGCAAKSDTFFLDINPYTIAGSVTSAASNDIICEGQSVDLYSNATNYQTVLLRENFNGGFSNWNATNNSISGTPANAAWTLRSNNYSFSGNTFSSNDQSQFYLSNSQAQGSGGSTSTILRSPMMNTVGFSTLNLDFFHFFNFRNSGDIAKVQVSTNNTTWTDLVSYTSTQGSLTGFTNSAINLNAYIGLPSLYIRFLYTATNDRYWAIDNVSITGVSNKYNYTWESSPSGFNSALQNPNNITPSLSRFYVLTATNTYGCVLSAIPLPITVNPKPADNAGVDKVICGSGGVMIGETASFGSTYSWTPSTGLSNSNIANPIASPSSAATYTLTETITATGCASSNGAIVTINSVPLIAETTSGYRCSSGPVTISALSSTGTVKWYANPTGGTALATSETYTTPSISSTTTFYADPSISGCAAGARTAVTASIFSPPTIISQTTSGATYSQNVTASPLTINANPGSGTISTYQWYSNTTASNLSGTLINGANEPSFVPSTAAVGTLYYYCTVTNSNNCSVTSAISGAINILLSPSITSVIPTLPLITDQLNNTGYRGQRITINGGNFISTSTVSFNGVAAINVVFVSANQLTAVVNNLGINSNANVTLTNPNNGAFATAPFNYIGYITNSTGDFNTAATWLAGTLPVINADATIAFANTLNSSFSPVINKLIVRTGTALTFGNTASSLSTISVDLSGALIFTATGTLNIKENFNLSANATFTPGIGTIAFNGTIDQILFTGANYLEFNTVTLSGGGNKSLGTQSSIKTSNLNIQSGTGFAPGTNYQNVVITGNMVVNGSLISGNSKFHFNGTGNQSISMIGAGTIQLNSMNVNKSGGSIIMSNNIQVIDTLQLTNGIINTNGNVLEIGTDINTTGILIYTNGYISGKLRRWFGARTNSGNNSGLFPIGQTVNGAWKSRFASVEYTVAPSVGGNLTAEFISIPMINGVLGSQNFIQSTNTGGAGFTVTNFSNNGYWNLEDLSGALTNGEFSITLVGEEFSLPNGLTQLTIVKRESGGNWFAPGTHIAPSGSYLMPQLKRNGISSLGNFGFAAGENNALPITLISFDAICEGNEISINWSTASESNNKEFNIEESKDAIQWKTAKTIAGAGNSNTIRNYSDKITSSFNGDSYLRLKQTDFNGDFEAFDPVYISCEKQNNSSVKIYPNPASDHVFIEITSSEKFEVLLSLFSANGQIVFSQKVTMQVGTNPIKLDLNNLPAGAYHLNISNENNIEIEGPRSIIKR